MNYTDSIPHERRTK